MGLLAFLMIFPVVSGTTGRPYGDVVPRVRDASPPYTDTLRALVIFVKFRDDALPGDPDLDYRGWPLFEDPTRLPLFARALLAPSPFPPYPDSSLTAYFHQQSNGHFLIFGDVLDSVMVSRYPEARYHRPEGGYGDLTQEVLDRLDAEGMDFSRYDYNADGRIDHLFFILRRDSRRDALDFEWTGISCLDARCGPGPAAGAPAPALSYDGRRVDWNTSGSYIINRTPGNILPYWYTVRMMAHELGHDLWAPFFVHLPAISRNDVPLKSNRSRGTTSIGYALMAGAGGGKDCRGNETISAFERDLLGWIDCIPLARDATAVRLTDLYTTGACFTLTVAGPQEPRRLYLSNLQRLGPFDRLHRAGKNPVYDAGLLRTTGLLVTLAEATRYDVLPADNTLDLSTRNAAYEGDLYGPPSFTQITPWTRPNLSGYTRYPPGFAPDWQAVDDIRYAGDASRTLTFDVHADFRLRPVIRQDSWIGSETKGYVFRVPFRVTGRSTLVLDTPLTFAGTLRLDAGTTVVLDAGADVTLATGSVLDLKAGTTLHVKGVLTLDGWIKRSPGARILVSEGGTLRTHLLR